MRYDNNDWLSMVFLKLTKLKLRTAFAIAGSKSTINFFQQMFILSRPYNCSALRKRISNIFL